MNLVLQREVLSDESTIGRLSIDGEQFCFTLEDKYRDAIEGKVIGKTCIPFGKYQVITSLSNRFKKVLPLLLKVPEFEGVRIHAGNTSLDTEGCILVGLTKGVDFVGKSQMALSLLQPMIEEALKVGEVWIDIRNP